MKKYIIQYENGAEVVHKFRSDSEALTFIADPRNLRTFGDMNLKYKSESGEYVQWDKHKRKWV